MVGTNSRRVWRRPLWSTWLSGHCLGPPGRPAPETLRRLAKFTRMPETTLAHLTIAGTDLPQRWWSIRQITPDLFAPNMEHTYRPTITFCRLCLWNDFITDGNEYLRVKWMAALPTICPLHRVPMEDSCNFCSAWSSRYLYVPAADFGSSVLTANDLSPVRRSAAR